MTRLDAAGAFSLAAWTALTLLSHRPGPLPIAQFLLVQLAAWTGIVAALLLARRPHRGRLLGRIWFWAVLFRLAGLLAQPVLEDDFYRYLWDGRALAMTGDPYTHAPAESFTELELPARFQVILDRINYPLTPTIYGPVCEWAFGLAYWLAPGQLWSWKLILLVADLAALGLLSRLLTPSQVLLYAWCPLLIQETAFNAHPDSLGVFFLLAALLVSLSGRWAGAALLLSLATGVKVTGALLAPLVLRRSGWKGWALFAAGLFSLYLPFLLRGASGGGAALATFGSRWEFNSSAYAVMGWLLGPEIARPLCLALVLAGCLWWVRHRPDGSPALTGLVLYGGFFLLAPVVNPWYLLWLLPFAVWLPSPAAIVAMAVVTLSYVTGLNWPDASLGPYDHPYWLRWVEYGIVMVAIASESFLRHRCLRLVRRKPIGQLDGT